MHKKKAFMKHVREDVTEREKKQKGRAQECAQQGLPANWMLHTLNVIFGSSLGRGKVGQGTASPFIF